MNSLNKVLGILMALTFAAFALPSAAVVPDKIFSVTALPTTLPAGATTTVTVVFKNEAPNGNSAINSLIITAPTGATITQVIPVSSPLTWSPAVSVSNPATSVSIAGVTGVKPKQTFTVKLGITVPPTTACHGAAWLGQGFAGNSFNGDAFVPVTPGANTPPAAVGCDGQLACNDPLPDSVTGPGVSEAKRELWNKDGGQCALVNYDFTNNISAANGVSILWDTQSTAVLSYTVQWKDEFVSPINGRPTGVTKLAWELNGINPIYEPGRYCLSSLPPTPYGKASALPAGVAGDTATITIDTSSPPTDGYQPLPTVGTFALNIGTERTKATYVSPNTYSIVRGDGLPAGTPVPAHPTPPATFTYAMSNPLPIVNDPASLYFGKQAQMCIRDETAVAVGSGPCPSPNQAQTCAIVHRITSLFDIGDGWSTGD